MCTYQLCVLLYTAGNVKPKSILSCSHGSALSLRIAGGFLALDEPVKAAEPRKRAAEPGVDFLLPIPLARFRGSTNSHKTASYAGYSALIPVSFLRRYVCYNDHDNGEMFITNVAA